MIGSLIVWPVARILSQNDMMIQELQGLDACDGVIHRTQNMIHVITVSCLSIGATCSGSILPKASVATNTTPNESAVKIQAQILQIILLLTIC